MRVVLGRVGRVLIVIGALVLGFVAYQLWGTGLEHASAQRALRAQFEEQLSSTVPNTSAPPTTIASARSSLPPPTVTTTTATTPATTATTVTPTTVTPTTPTAVTPSTTVPPPPPRPTFAEGDPVARLEIPRIGVDEIVVAGVGSAQLKQGPGHYLQTPLPGEPGNAALAGHRTTYGAPFLDLDQLEPGDEIVVTTYAGRFVYRMNGSVIVTPSDVSVLGSTVDDRLTLTTCSPKYSAKERLVVTAAMDHSSSSPLAGTTAAPAAPVAVPDPVPTELTTIPSATTTTSPAAAEPVAVEPFASEPVVQTSRRPAGLESTVEPTGQVLAGDRFGDARRWPYVVLWGALCAAVALGSSLVGRRLGRRWVGRLIGVVPFLVLLFAFYRSLDRLITPPR